MNQIQITTQSSFERSVNYLHKKETIIPALKIFSYAGVAACGYLIHVTIHTSPISLTVAIIGLIVFTILSSCFSRAEKRLTEEPTPKTNFSLRFLAQEQDEDELSEKVIPKTLHKKTFSNPFIRQSDSPKQEPISTMPSEMKIVKNQTPATNNNPLPFWRLPFSLSSHFKRDEVENCTNQAISVLQPSANPLYLESAYNLCVQLLTNIQARLISIESLRRFGIF